MSEKINIVNKCKIYFSNRIFLFGNIVVPYIYGLCMKNLLWSVNNYYTINDDYHLYNLIVCSNLKSETIKFEFLTRVGYLQILIKFVGQYVFILKQILFIWEMQLIESQARLRSACT